MDLGSYVMEFFPIGRPRYISAALNTVKSKSHGPDENDTSAPKAIKCQSSESRLL